MIGAGCVWKIARNKKRADPDYEPPAQRARPLPDGGYMVLHPTKGWRRVCAARVSAGGRMASMLDNYIQPRRKRPAKLYRKPMPCPPSQDSRQQRRRRAMTGQPNPYA